MIYFFLAFAAGILATLQAGVNARLLTYLGTPILAALISFSVGTFSLAALYGIGVYLGWQSIPSLASLAETKAWMWTGGLLGAFFVFVTVFCSPKIGFANVFSLIVAGQIILAVTFDQYGLLGAPFHPVSPLRLVGMVLLVVSVYLIETN